MNYTIVGNGTQASAFRNGMGLPEIEGNAGTVIQRVIDTLCPNNSPEYEGGGIITLIGSFNMWASPLVIKNWMLNNQRPTTTLIIEGVGNTLLLFNGLPDGAHAITIKNGANVDFRNLDIVFPQSTGGSAIRIEKGDTDIASWKGVFHDLVIKGASETDYTFYAENFFNFDMQRVIIECVSNGIGSMLLYNNSTTTNFGNSKFQNLSLLAPDRNDGAALKISSIDVAHPMNLNSFDVLNIGTNFYGPGQPAGRGIWLNGGSYSTFNHIDVEYMPNSLYFEAARKVTILSGYIHPDGSNGVGIYCSNQTNGCQFNLEVDADDVNTVIVSDSGMDKEPNSFNLSLSGAANQSKINIENMQDCAISVRKNGCCDQTNQFATLLSKRLKIPVGNSNPENNDIWIDGDAIKIKIGETIKTISLT
jgi:hypothetical protein